MTQHLVSMDELLALMTIFNSLFTVDDSAFGVNGRAPCTNDHIQFFDGTASNADSLLKLCNLPRNYDFQPITTTSSRARVVFTGSINSRRPASRVGVKVDYQTV